MTWLGSCVTPASAESRFYSCSVRSEGGGGGKMGGALEGNLKKKGGEERGVCSVTFTVAQSDDLKEDNSSRPPLAPIGCEPDRVREGVRRGGAGSPHLQKPTALSSWLMMTPPTHPASPRGPRMASPSPVALYSL